MRPARTRVKICGVTNRADAQAAVELGADALGFNLHRGSKRFIDLEKEAAWIRELPPFVTKVAVMVRPSIADAEAVFERPFIDAVQFHGGEDEAFCTHFARLGLPFIKAIALQDAALLDDPGRFGTRFVLLDTSSPRGFGGTGELVDLDLAEKFAARHRELSVILSGGLNPANVADAVRRVRPYAVDVASGVESGPGKKDAMAVGEFIRAAGGAGGTD
jgi:phosphoribosylanthranilate isomerase